MKTLSLIGITILLLGMVKIINNHKEISVNQKEVQLIFTQLHKKQESIPDQFAKVNFSQF